MRRARFLITPDLLFELLHLPAETQFVVSLENGLYVEIVVEHPDLPEVAVVPGERPPLVQPRFRKQEAVVFEGWT